MSRSIVVDEEGYFIAENGLRLNDNPLGLQMLSSFEIDPFGVVSFQWESQKIRVEAFDKPYVAQQIHLDEDTLEIQLPYQLRMEIDPSTLSLDAWDRIHGFCLNGVPFVLTHKAQAELFNLAQEFTDESLKINGQWLETPVYYQKSQAVETEGFWSDKYKSKETPWNLDGAHPEFKSSLQQIKMNKCRVLVPGCGQGHDAALLAEQGHIVTAVDMSPTAIEEAKTRYGHLKNLQFVLGDVFKLDGSHQEAYDLVLEHTCYCAIDPSLRKDLVKKWNFFLAEEGHLLGVFFVVPKRTGPYFGGSEWELREELKNNFQFLYWTRLKHSPDWRLGAELLVYAKKRAKV